MHKLVSIIIPAYNADRFLKKTIDSVVGQSYTNWELIVIDDGSTDNTRAIVQEYATEHRNIHYHHQLNAGVSAARNRGINLSNGQYIAFLDADDLWLETNLESKLNTLETNQEIEWVYSDICFIDEHDHVIEEPTRGIDKNVFEEILLWKGEVVPVPCSNVILRMKCFESGIRFDTDLSTAADQEFCLQLARIFKAIIIRDRLVSYRVTNESMSSNILVMERDELMVYKKAAQRKWFKSFVFKQRCFSNMYLILAGSWWKDGNNKMRGLGFLIKSILVFPPNIFKIMGKLFVTTHSGKNKTVFS